jgi:5'-AMP-activated protein kinase catalytic alpha subunit
MVGKSLG